MANRALVENLELYKVGLTERQRSGIGCVRPSCPYPFWATGRLFGGSHRGRWWLLDDAISYLCDGSSSTYCDWNRSRAGNLDEAYWLSTALLSTLSEYGGCRLYVVWKHPCKSLGG